MTPEQQRIVEELLQLQKSLGEVTKVIRAIKGSKPHSFGRMRKNLILQKDVVVRNRDFKSRW